MTTSSQEEIIEETPAKDDGNENETITSEKMTRDIQRLAHRLRSSLPCKLSLINREQTNVISRFSCQYTIYPFMKLKQTNQRLFIYLK